MSRAGSEPSLGAGLTVISTLTRSQHFSASFLMVTILDAAWPGTTAEKSMPLPSARMTPLTASVFSLMLIFTSPVVITLRVRPSTVVLATVADTTAKISRRASSSRSAFLIFTVFTPFYLVAEHASPPRSSGRSCVPCPEGQGYGKIRLVSFLKRNRLNASSPLADRFKLSHLGPHNAQLISHAINNIAFSPIAKAIVS